MPSYAASAPIAQHRGGDPQLAGDLHQWPTAACQQGDRLRLELIRKMTLFLAHSTPSRSRRSLAKVSINSGEAHQSNTLATLTRPLAVIQNRSQRYGPHKRKLNGSTRKPEDGLQT